MNRAVIINALYMKTKYIQYFSLTFLICSLACATQKMIGYDFPNEMNQDVKKSYTSLCDKGQILYDINCGKCHTKIKYGKKIVPDFKPEQLVGYGLRISNARHESSLPDTLVTEEELGLIMTFLKYKKKNTP